MGLDMYAFYATPEDHASVNDGGEGTRYEFMYWRKHNALHKWMEDKFYEKGGEGEFNCVSLVLTNEDLDELESDIKENNLTPTKGFFFGSTDYDPSYNADEDLDFISKAREHLKDGMVVMYDSWW